MKTQHTHKHGGNAVVAVERKHSLPRGGTKTFAHRYERRKIREQLRHLDWALAEAD